MGCSWVFAGFIHIWRKLSQELWMFWHLWFSFPDRSDWHIVLQYLFFRIVYYTCKGGDLTGDVVTLTKIDDVTIWWRWLWNSSSSLAISVLSVNFMATLMTNTTATLVVYIILLHRLVTVMKNSLSVVFRVRCISLLKCDHFSFVSFPAFYFLVLKATKNFQRLLVRYCWIPRYLSNNDNVNLKFTCFALLRSPSIFFWAFFSRWKSFTLMHVCQSLYVIFVVFACSCFGAMLLLSTLFYSLPNRTSVVWPNKRHFETSIYLLNDWEDVLLVRLLVSRPTMLHRYCGAGIEREIKFFFLATSIVSVNRIFNCSFFCFATK